jgi:hypothetical protein
MLRPDSDSRPAVRTVKSWWSSPPADWLRTSPFVATRTHEDAAWLAGRLLRAGFFNQVAVTGATTSTLSFTATQTANAGTYQVLVTGPGAAIISRSVTLNVTAAAVSTAASAAAARAASADHTASAATRADHASVIVSRRSTVSNMSTACRETTKRSSPSDFM